MGTRNNAESILVSGKSTSSGFTILELVAVVSVLSILAGISIPAFVDVIKSSRIDEAKAKLNSAIGECLQLYRNDPDSAATAEVPSQYLVGLENAGYLVEGSKNKCGDFLIKPKNAGESFLYPMGFMVENGRVRKIAYPASDEGSRKSCEAWGICGIPPELQAKWDRIAEIEAAKKQCNENFYTWLRKPSSGTNSRWDDASNSCSIQTWAFEGSIQANEAAYKDAEKRKYGEICAEKTKSIKDAKELTGPYQITECGERQFFFCLGEDKGTKEAMDACVLANKEAKCIADENAALMSGHKGKYGPHEGPGQCGNIKWMCNGVAVNSEEAYLKDTECAVKACSEPPHGICWMNPNHDVCTGWSPVGCTPKCSDNPPHPVCLTNPSHDFCTYWVKC